MWLRLLKLQLTIILKRTKHFQKKSVIFLQSKKSFGHPFFELKTLQATLNLVKSSVNTAISIEAYIQDVLKLAPSAGENPSIAGWNILVIMSLARLISAACQPELVYARISPACAQRGAWIPTSSSTSAPPTETRVLVQELMMFIAFWVYLVSPIIYPNNACT